MIGNHLPSVRGLRWFGCMLALMLGFWAYRVLPRWPFLGAVLGLLAVLVCAAAAWAPGALGTVYRTWMAAVLPVRWTVSQLLAVVVFYGVIVPVGLALRFAGYDPLRRQRPATESYWVARPRPGNAPGYLRQF